MELPIITESLTETTHLHHTHIIDIVLKLASPEVDAVHRPRVALIVGPEGSKRIPTGNTFCTGCSVVSFEFLKYQRVVDISDSHVV